MDVLSSFGCCVRRDQSCKEHAGEQQHEEEPLDVSSLLPCPVDTKATGDAYTSLQAHAGKSGMTDSGLGCTAACSSTLAGCFQFGLRKDKKGHKIPVEGLVNGIAVVVAEEKTSAVYATVAAATQAPAEEAAAAAAAQSDGAEALLALFDDRALESPEYVLDKAVCSRFLAARKGHIGKAAHALRKYQAWRKSAKPALITVADIPTEFASGKAKHHGFDLAGRPIIWAFMRYHNTYSRDIEETVRLFLFLFEAAVRASEAAGVQRVTLIFDLEGFGYKAMDLEFVKRLLDIMKVYPERLGQVLLWRAPRSFAVFWKLVRPILDPDTFQRTKFVGPAQLSEFVDPKQVPQ